ncbi:serine hydrolase domain-containing protein [Marinifilum flexuosum]|uniref:serine hydrolase domain-containing protein n=1 Tax=Marinifilum flexuosum TaxID=1117708 RepID=UPI002493DD5D|nr:serine hydrolase domain-containing protein [Marinifilum flexuosum]
MKYLTSIFVIISLLVSCKKELSLHHPNSLEKYSDSLFAEAIKNNKIVGASILISHKNKIFLDKNYGYANIELSTNMPVDAVFEIGSVTKQFTAVAILKLAEQGKINIDDDFTDYLNFDTKGRKVTIKNLLEHTSGIVNYTEIPKFWSLSVQDLPRDSLVSLVEQEKFQFEPQENFIYNNSGYFFLGLIIEKVSGKTYEEYLKEEFFIPLAMKNTSYCSMNSIVENKVNGYASSKNGLQLKDYINHKWPYSGGSLCSTTNDLLIWMKALHHNVILSKNSYHSLIEPIKLNNGTKLHYAKGLVNFLNYGNVEIGHSGYIPGFISKTQYFPKEDLYIICLINTSGLLGVNYFTDQIDWKILKKKISKPIPMDIDSKMIEGTYSSSVENKKLSLQVSVNSDKIILTNIQDQKTDTLKTYVGNNTWMNKNDIITIRNGIYEFKSEYEYYYLELD